MNKQKTLFCGDIIYLTNSSGEVTGRGTIKVSRKDIAKIPFGDAPGYITPYCVEIGGSLYMLGNLEIAYTDENGGENEFMSKDRALRYARDVHKYLRDRLQDGHILLDINQQQAGRPGRPCSSCVGVAIPMDTVEDHAAAKAVLDLVFGMAANLPDGILISDPTYVSPSL